MRKFLFAGVATAMTLLALAPKAQAQTKQLTPAVLHSTFPADYSDVTVVREFATSGKPIAAICHAPWVLVEAGVARGRTLTSWPTLQTDIRNAGGTWVDKEVVVDDGIVTSRKPDDIPAFNKKMIEEFCEGRHEDRSVSQTTSASA